ncbi:enterochelin esterase [Salmonella enterica subsp. enterica serovar Daytona]|uniref:Enterochelin esterase n=1 Tax=Salmonella enterica subsp. enterica serovar Daytona TaxID=1962639 RepID=A0A447JE06_SALET|nr:enterochelin esterase [Salmonella enterica subsp. enterica serovar Daytona]
MRLSPPLAPVAIQTATRLRRQLAAGSQVDASHFWREANSLALPLVTAINDADDEREVTFLWRAASPLRGVYVRLNRVTDKDNVAKGMMTQLPTTDIWHLTLRLPASYCGSYTMVEIPPETPDETVLQLGSRFASLVGKADPLNSTPGINVRVMRRSLFWRWIMPRHRRSGQAVALTPGSFSPQNIGSPDNVAVCGCIFLTFLSYNRWAYWYSRMARSGSTILG